MCSFIQQAYPTLKALNGCVNSLYAPEEMAFVSGIILIIISNMV